MSDRHTDILETIATTRLVPVVVIDDAATAAPLGEALLAGGLPVAEVTLRTDAAEDSIRQLAQMSNMTVGAGTVLTPEQVDRAVDAGARFIVMPGYDHDVVARAQHLGIPIFPGIASASDIQRALKDGLDTVKFFPAEPLGGMRMITALAGPFPQVKFMPTGGVSPNNLGDYLKHPAILAVGGSWMVTRKLLAAKDFATVRRLAEEAVTSVPR